VSELELQMMHERDSALLKADYWRGLFLCLLSFVAVALFYIILFRASASK